MPQLPEIKNGRIVPIRKFYSGGLNGGENVWKPKSQITNRYASIHNPFTRQKKIISSFILVQMMYGIN